MLSMIMAVPLYFMNQRWNANSAFLVARRARHDTHPVHLPGLIVAPD
jgi:hypothetical protein